MLYYRTYLLDETNAPVAVIQLSGAEFPTFGHRHFVAHKLDLHRDDLTPARSTRVHAGPDADQTFVTGSTWAKRDPHDGVVTIAAQPWAGAVRVPVFVWEDDGCAKGDDDSATADAGKGDDNAPAPADAPAPASDCGCDCEGSREVPREAQTMVLTSDEITEALRASFRTGNVLIQEMDDTIARIQAVRKPAQDTIVKSLFVLDVWADFDRLSPLAKTKSFIARSKVQLSVAEAQGALTMIPGHEDRTWTIVSVDRNTASTFNYTILV